MERLNNLYNKIADFSNLDLAERKARAGKSNRSEVLVFNLDRERNLRSIQQSLLNKSFVTSAYSTFQIYEPKERTVYRLPYYPDRIIHHAIMNVLDPVFCSMFTNDTYSCIKGRGLHKAVYNLKSALRDTAQTKYCLKLDIQKFYPSVDHTVLKELLRKKFKDIDLLNLLDGIIDSTEGLPIGSYLSQYFANFYLSGFDHWIKEIKRVKYYFRYADDIVILSASKSDLHRLRFEIQQYLYQHLKLQVKSNYQVFPVNTGIDFLGYVFYSHKYTLLRKSIKQRFIKMIKHNRNPSSIASYKGWISYCCGKNLWNKYVGHAA